MSGRLRFLRTTSGAIGVAASSCSWWLVAVFGQYLAPHDPTVPVGVPAASAAGAPTAGTDFLGRDVLSRLLYGGRSVLGLAVLATVAGLRVRAARSAWSPATRARRWTRC